MRSSEIHEFAAFFDPRSFIAMLDSVGSRPYRHSQVAPGYFLPAGSWLDWRDKRVLGTYAPSPRIIEWTGQSVVVWLDQFRELLGDVFPDVLATFHRGQRSPSPPHMPHRLAQLVSLVLPAVCFYRLDTVPYVDPVYVAELYAHLAAIRRADQEPVWRSELRPAAKDPKAYLHDLILFMSLDMLDRSFGTVGPLLSSATSSREPDLHFTVGKHPVRIEIKVPERLILFDLPFHERKASFNTTDADQVIAKAVSDAVGTHGQIRPDRPGIVIIGGFNLIPEEVSAIEAAATVYMERHGARRPYLIGVGLHFMNFGRGMNLFGAGRVMPGYHVLPNASADGPVRLTSISRLQVVEPATGRSAIRPPAPQALPGVGYRDRFPVR